MRVSGAPPASWPYTGQSPAEACRLASRSRISIDFPRDQVAQMAKLVLAAESKEAFDDAAMSKSARLNSLYSSAMCGNSSRQGAHQDAQKFTSVTLPR